ncbi:hypothetical protein [Nocardioides conyzicola]|uniref:Indole-3-glycerol phosphate synthase n=1 Tax=Nocardioides conyzicola TaxID=1651781 RepID=A0ABP8XMB8_9ACTN
MSENAGEDYDVVLLIEQALSEQDAAQVHSLHEGLVDQGVVYHVLLPLEDAAARIESAMGSLTAGDMLASPTIPMSEVDLDAVRKDCEDRTDSELKQTLDALTKSGAVARGQVVTDPPIDALAAKVAEVDGREAIILTRPHVVAEFFHLDWTSKARRKLGVPILHLLEHETFDEQSEAYGEEGITGL